MINALKEMHTTLTVERDQVQKSLNEVQNKLSDCNKCIEALEPKEQGGLIEGTCYQRHSKYLTFADAVKKLLNGGQSRQPDLWRSYSVMEERPTNLGYDDFKICIRSIESHGVVKVHLGDRNTNVVSLIK